MKIKLLLILFVISLNQTLAQENCNIAVVASSGTNTLPTTENSSYWYKYTATQDGKIQISSSDNNFIYVYSGIDCSSLTYEIDGYNNVTFNEAFIGETYYFRWSLNSDGDFDWTLTELDIEPGDNCNNAIAAISGINTLPATSNTEYWYKYTATQDGKIQINSSEGDNIYIYSGIDCSSLMYESDGYNNATFTDAVNGETYYIQWYIYSDGDFNWTLTELDIEPGDNCNNPVTATSGINTVPSTANSEYWYEYTATQDGVIKINSSDNNSIYIYSGIDCSLLSYEDDGYNNITFTEALNGVTYYIRWRLNSGGDFNWTLTEAAPEPGDNCDNAAIASSGINTLPTTTNDDYWYEYTITQNGKIEIYSMDGFNFITYLNGCSNNLGDSEEGYLKITDLIAGDVITIKWSPFGGGFDWSLTDSAIEPGDSCEEPVQALLGSNTSGFTEFWYEFITPSTGNYTISSVGTATNDTFLKVYSDCAGTLLDQNDDFSDYQSQLTLNLTEGQVIYILWDDVYSPLGFDWTLSADEALDQTITFNALDNKTFDDADFELTATASSGLDVSYSSSNENIATINGSTVTIVGAGTTTITASQTGNESFNPAIDVEQLFTVNKANQTISVEEISDKATTNNSFNIVASTTSGLDLTYAVSGPASITGNTITLNGSEGQVTITVSQAGNANYNAAMDKSISFNVSNPLTIQTITFNEIEDQFLIDESLSLTATASSGLAVTYEIVSGPATVSGNAVTFTGLGTVTVRASQSGNSVFLPAATVEQSFEVIRTTQTITFEAIDDQSFSNGTLELSATASSGLDVTYEIVSGPATVSGNVVTFTDLGEVTVVASQAGDDDFLAAPTIEQSFTIFKNEQTITFNSILDQFFEAGSLTLSAVASSGLEVSYDIVNGPAAVSGNVVSFTDLGTVVIRANQAGDNSFLAAEPVEQSFDVITVTGVDDITSALLIYPNPAKDVLTIQTQQEDVSIKLLDLNGTTVMSIRANTTNSISHLKSGIYFLRIAAGDKLTTHKIIKN